MERIVIINESTFTKLMEQVKELLSVLHCQEQQVKNKGIGTWLDTSEVCVPCSTSANAPYKVCGSEANYPILR